MYIVISTMRWTSLQPRLATPACMLIVMAILSSMIPALSSSAEPISTWLDSSKNPSLTKGETISQAEYSDLLQKRQGFTNQECINKKIAVRPKSLGYTAKYYDGCWYTTKIGLLEKDGLYLLQPGTQVAGLIKGSTTDRKLRPTPNPNVFLELVADAGTGYGSFINFRDLNGVEFNRETAPSTGTVTLTYKNSAVRLRTSSSSIHVENSDIWYSSNAKWMLKWSDGGTLIRINLENFKALRVFVRDAPRYNKLTGAADISDDGRHVAVAITNPLYKEFYVIDLDTCASNESIPASDTLSTCPKRTLNTYFNTAFPAYNYTSLPRFYGNNTIGLYHVNPDQTYTRYSMQAPDTQAITSHYLAMGDSFASGEGAFNYEPGTDDPVNKCHLSKKSYPYLISQQMALSSFRSIACSGAKIENVIGGDEEENQNELPANISDKSHPGYYRQLRNMKEIQPNVVTISMSGNDIGFADKVKYCVAYANDCFDTYEDRLEIIREINSKFDSITNMYKQIKQTTPPNTKIYVIGYPQITSSDIKDSCGVNVHLSAQERLFANQLITYFNKVIKNAAAKEGVFYTGIEGSLMGSRLCETASAAVAVNGVTAGNDSGIGMAKVIGQESYHPNATGHMLMKNAILEKTDYFTKPMPSPDPTSIAPDETETPLLEAPKSGRKINKTNYDGNANNNMYYHNGWLNESIEAILYKLVPLSDYFVELHSNPVKLGTVTSDLNGDLSINLQIPNSVPPGMHTLHIYGQNTDGESIDIYRYIYVGANEADFDGDGIPNSEEACSLVEAAGVDSDNDNIDDACDDIITESTQETPETPPTPQGEPPHNPSEPAQPNETATPPIIIPDNPTFSQNSTSVPLQPVIATQTPSSIPTRTISPTNEVLSGNTLKLGSATTPTTHASYTALEHKPHKTPQPVNLNKFIVILCSILFIIISSMVYAKRKAKYE